MLILGLIAGVALPDVALAMKPWLPEMVAILLFLAALRIDPGVAFGNLRQVRNAIPLVFIYQLVLPLMVLGVFLSAGLFGPMAVALTLMCAAPSISGGPNLAILSGHDPTAALRLLAIGTALVPLTAFPIFWLSPMLGSPVAVIVATGRLLAVVGLAMLLAFVIRRYWMKSPTKETIRSIDGVSALGMAIIVVGLMSAIGPALQQQPIVLLWTMLIVFAANFGLQIVAFLLHRFRGLNSDTASLSIIAGNRNMALFLASLPASVTDPILLFIGCYQVPMYLTPILMSWLYKRAPGYLPNSA